jgi:hypothetical protein
MGAWMIWPRRRGDMLIGTLVEDEITGLDGRHGDVLVEAYWHRGSAAGSRTPPLATPHAVRPEHRTFGPAAPTYGLPSCRWARDGRTAPPFPRPAAPTGGTNSATATATHAQPAAGAAAPPRPGAAPVRLGRASAAPSGSAPAAPALRARPAPRCTALLLLARTGGVFWFWVLRLGLGGALRLVSWPIWVSGPLLWPGASRRAAADCRRQPSVALRCPGFRVGAVNACAGTGVVPWT